MRPRVLSIFDYYDGPLSGEVEWEGERCYYLWLGEKSPRSYGLWPLAEEEWALIKWDRQEDSQESSGTCGVLHDELMERPKLAQFRDEDASWPPIPWDEL